MAGHGRPDDEAWLLRCTLGQVASDVHEPAEGALPNDSLVHRNFRAVHDRAVDPELGLAVAARHALEHVTGRSNLPAKLRVSHGV